MNWFISFKNKLKKIFSRKNVVESLLFVATVSLSILTAFTVYINYSDSDSRIRIERYKQTINLCKDFNSWYDNYYVVETDTSLIQVKQWDTSLPCNGECSWQSIPDSIKLMSLIKNPAAIKLFNYFEEAKMLDQKKLLDRDYFYNFFSSTMLKFKNKTKEPTVEEFLLFSRKYYKDEQVWDGFDYCMRIVQNMEDEYESKPN